VNDRGVKSIAPFGDRNSLGDILGEIFFANSYPAHWDYTERHEYPTIQGTLMQASDRIQHKLARSKSVARSELFAQALECLERAKDAYFDRNFQLGGDLLVKVEQFLEQGNKLR